MMELSLGLFKKDPLGLCREHQDSGSGGRGKVWFEEQQEADVMVLRESYIMDSFIGHSQAFGLSSK